MKRNKRNKKRGSGISLFAFQDIICAVIGILFLIVLLAALDIVENIEHADDDSHNLSSAQEMIHKIDQLKKTKAVLSDSLLNLISSKNNIMMGPQYYKLQLKNTNINITYLMSVSDKKDKQLILVKQDEQSIKVKLEKIASNQKNQQQRIQLLEGELVILIDKVNTKFIKDGLATKEPILVILSKSEIVVSKGINRSAEFRFQMSERSKFITWAKGNNRSLEYFVIFNKPSVGILGNEIINDLKRLGFKVGKDLIPEDHKL